MDIQIYLAETVWILLAFMFGIAWGSFINVVAGRLPLEKSVLWPSSHCLTCLKPLNFGDNLPVIGWLRLRGRCRFCGTHFSSRYMWIELLTGVIFAVMFYLEVMRNWQKVPFFTEASFRLFIAEMPWQAVIFFLHHAILVSFLLAASLCDIDYRSIPLSLTSFGTVVGLFASIFLAWPWPSDVAAVKSLSLDQSWSFMVKPGDIPSGLYVWPVWGPLPSWLPAGSPQLGLVTGLVGALAGMFLVRSVKFLFEKGLGKEALGLGDADLLMMAGAFVGWQIVVVAFFVGSILSLPLGIILALQRGERTLPFGPGLATGVMVTLFAWPWLRLIVQPYLFDEVILLSMGLFLGGGMFIASMILRLLGRGK